ncbi:MAG: hypothetical protein AAFU68_02885 [Pseudomonadota bacterium]
MLTECKDEDRAALKAEVDLIQKELIDCICRGVGHETHPEPQRLAWLKEQKQGLCLTLYGSPHMPSPFVSREQAVRQREVDERFNAMRGIVEG